MSLIRILTAAAFVLLLVPGLAPAADAPKRRPNVLLIMTDDQGYGDLGCHGNPKIRTPNLDRLARESAELRHFYVCPVCSPTRSSLMTGRYNYRTGVVDTYIGRSLMRPDETTLAEILSAAGYRTGIFGKWHLGDNYPLRPQDQGFQEVLVLKGGGIGQPSDPPGGSSYLDPLLQHNGKPERFKGYCSDVYTDAAIRFVTADSEKPFFAYLAFNAPHTPLQAPAAELKQYEGMNLALSEFPKFGYPVTGKYSPEETARVYAMVTNIDNNLGRLFKKLDEAKLTDNTLVIFLTDNGPQQPRYNSGMRGRKGTVYEGGIRVPFFARWPGVIPPGRSNEVAAHIDILPTVLDACGVPLPKDLKIDGRSILPVLKGEKVELPERTLFFQWHRGDVPQRNRACAARGPVYKLVQAFGAGMEPLPDPLHFQLFDLKADPYEEHDISGKHPDVVAKMRKEYEAWFDSVTERGFAPPRIQLGTEHENPSVLTPQDWRGPRSGWKPGDEGYWEVQVVRPGNYRVTLHFGPAKTVRFANVHFENVKVRKEIPPEADAHTFEVKLPEGKGDLEAFLSREGKRSGVRFVEVKRVGE